MNKNSIEDFFLFVFNRQEIWYKRNILKLDPPWTTDPTLSIHKYCNVYRELDKGTIYLLKSLSEHKYSQNFRRIALFNTLIYRVFNLTNLFNDIYPIIDPKDYKRGDHEEVLDRAVKKKLQLFNDAYTICQVPVNSEYRKRDKHVQVTFIFDYLAKHIDDFIMKIDECQTPEKSLDIICSLPNIGRFLGNQIWCDLTYFRFFKQGWTDNDFTTIGPGSGWGLEILTGEKKLTDSEKFKLMLYLRDIQEDEFEKLKERTGKDWLLINYKYAFSNIPYLSLANIQSSLCEYRKYYNNMEDIIRGGRQKYRKRYYRGVNNA